MREKTAERAIPVEAGIQSTTVSWFGFGKWGNCEAARAVAGCFDQLRELESERTLPRGFGNGNRPSNPLLPASACV
jgi:hypothetical protein